MDILAARKLRPTLGAPATRLTDLATFPEPARSRVQEVFDFAEASHAWVFTGITAGGHLVTPSMRLIAVP